MASADQPADAPAGDALEHVVYGPNTSRVAKVLWMLREVGVPFRHVDSPIAALQQSEAYLTLNPKGTVPTAVFRGADGGEDLVLNESNTIVSYIAHKYGAGTALYPASPERLATAWQWLEWTESSVQPTLSPVWVGLMRGDGFPSGKGHALEVTLGADGKPQRVNGVEVVRALKVWEALEKHLGAGERAYVLGADFSLADVTAGIHANRLFHIPAEKLGHDPAGMFPSVHAWYRRLCERPGFQAYVIPQGSG